MILIIIIFIQLYFKTMLRNDDSDSVARFSVYISHNENKIPRITIMFIFKRMILKKIVVEQ